MMLRKLFSIALCAAMAASGSVYAMADDGGGSGDAAASGSLYAAASDTFTDVAAGSWYESAVSYVTGKGLFSGTGIDTFDPDGSMTRGMFVTVLGRAAGVTPADTATGYSDVSADKYYAPYIKWASDNSIVTGTGNGKFDPDTGVNREQMCTILVRYLRDYKKLDLSKYTESSVTFSDSADISSWALEEVSIAQQIGLVEGSEVNGAVVFDPDGDATRAAAAAVFMRLDQSMSTLEPDSSTSGGDDQAGNSDASGGSSSGGSSSGGDGTSSGGDSSSDVTHTDEEIAEEAEVAGYLQNMSTSYAGSAYKQTVDEPVRESMDLLMSVIDEVLAKRADGAFISTEYLSANYGTEISQFRTMYDALTEDQINQIQNLAIRLETEAHIYYVFDYFGITQADIANL